MANDEDRFHSHMVKAFHSLTSAQLQLVGAQAHSRTSSDNIDRAWELLWGNLKSVVSLACVIRVSLLEQRTFDAAGVATQPDSHPETPLLPPDHIEFEPVLSAVEGSMRCAEELRRHASDAYERLIFAGRGDSDSVSTMSMIRLYAQASHALLETVKAELQIPQAALAS